MITPDNIIRHELVGLHGTVSGSSNPQLVGMSGVVINETRHMLYLDTKRGIKSVPKGINQWVFGVKGQSIHINGAKITRRSAERLMIKT